MLSAAWAAACGLPGGVEASLPCHESERNLSTSQPGVGILRLRFCFASEAETFAQDDIECSDYLASGRPSV
jgi:hypothetical protein